MAHETITLAQSYLPSTFPNYSSSVWLFTGSDSPSIIYSPAPSAPNKNITDDNISVRIYDSQIHSISNFPNYSSSTWSFTPDNPPALIYSPIPDEPDKSIDDDNISQRITFSQATNPDTWNSVGYDIERVWNVRVGRQMPRLIRKGTEGDQGSPLEHSKHYIMVEPHVDGTMNWDGITWKYITTFLRNPNPSLVGSPGDRVTYAVPPIDENQLWFDPTQNKRVPIKFIASALRDPFGAGGFSNYTNEKVRSDILNNSYSTIINFYFARVSDLPRLNYKLKIQTPTKLLEANTTFQATGPILVSTNPETFELVTIPYVDIDDPNALPVHISTPDGIKALTKYIEDKEYKLKGNDEE